MNHGCAAEKDYKYIATLNDLRAVESDSDEVTRYILCRDIDLLDVSNIDNDNKIIDSVEWTPLRPARGIRIDGCGHSILNLPDALFEYLPEGSAASRLTLACAVYSSKSEVFGAFAKEADCSAFSGCKVTGLIVNRFTVQGQDCGSRVGAFAGNARGCSFEDCVNEANIQTVGTYSTGGIAGTTRECSLKRCENYGKIYALNGVPAGAIGGLAGSTDSGTIIGSTEGICLNFGDIIGSNGVGWTCSLGGIVGFNRGVIERCVNMGRLVNHPRGDESFDLSSSGGIAGDDYYSILDCVSAGDIEGGNNAGGIVGMFCASGWHDASVARNTVARVNIAGEIAAGIAASIRAPDEGVSFSFTGNSAAAGSIVGACWAARIYNPCGRDFTDRFSNNCGGADTLLYHCTGVCGDIPVNGPLGECLSNCADLTAIGYGANAANGDDCVDIIVHAYPIVLDPNNGQPKFVVYTDADRWADLPRNVQPPVCGGEVALLGWYTLGGRKVKRGDRLESERMLVADWGTRDAGCEPFDTGDALADVIESIASGEAACGAMLESGAETIRQMVELYASDCAAYDCQSILDLIGSVKDMTASVSEFEAQLARKMFMSLEALTKCGRAGASGGSAGICDAARDALNKVLRSIRGEDWAISALIDSGASALGTICPATGCAAGSTPCGYAGSDGCVPTGNECIIDMFDAVAGLANATADVEERMSSKLCMSLNSLCADTPDNQPCAIDPGDVGGIIESIALCDKTTSAIIAQGAAAYGFYDTTNQPTAFINSLSDLLGAAKRIGQANVGKLRCSLTALCETGPTIDCPCDGANAYAWTEYPLDGEYEIF
ncbi:MAG: hypothetical protein LBK46_01835 [Oscillospiraceae bacterium]|jgi:hypothetical protein|nr:hypothetical protein [Oscillospiraceae bacterium]